MYNDILRRGLAESADPDDAPVARALLAQADVRTTADGVSLDQILHDRPDVFAAFYTEYYGALRDHHSDAWTLRVGGDTPQDYANYWYETYGKFEGYEPVRPAASPVEDPEGGFGGGEIAATGRTTADGVSLDQILRDRPDVYRAFFSEFYGPNNDHKSHAWIDRVGGETPQDYANYWYERYGVFSYTPSNGAAAPGEPPAEDPVPGDPAAGDPDRTPRDPPPVAVDPGSDAADAAAQPIPDGVAVPLVVHYSDDGGFELFPATPEEFARLYANGGLFDPSLI